ncbi:MAG: NADPH:quinone oxidoreductase family protein [Burkholderiales bacterium]
MKTLLVRGYGPEDKILLEDTPAPAPRAGEVQVRVHAAGVSFVDLLVARGGYQVRPPVPFVPGSEFSGVVHALGEGTDGTLKVGDRVCGTRQGAWAEYISLPQAMVLPLPAEADFVASSVLLASYFTALYALRERGQLRAGETLLVLGASGGVGHAAVQIGKVLGARVFAAASTAAAREAARAAGADETVDSASPDWKDQVKALAPKGVDVVYDPVGGDATDAGFRTLGWNGRLLMIGFAGGQIGQLKTNLSIVKGASLVGVDARQFGEREGAHAAQVRRDVVALYEQGRIKPMVGHVFPVERFSEAEAKMGDRALFGRVVLTF